MTTRWIAPDFIAAIGKRVVWLALIAGIALTLFLPVRVVVSAPGAVEGTPVIVASPFEAPVAHILVRSGSPVSAGDPIALMDTAPIEENVRMLRSKLISRRRAHEAALAAAALESEIAVSQTEQAGAFLDAVGGGADPNLMEQLNARLNAVRAALAQAEQRRAGHQRLFRLGTVSKNQLDMMIADVDRLTGEVQAMEAELKRLVVGVPDTVSRPQKAALKSSIGQEPLRRDRALADAWAIQAEADEIETEIQIYENYLARCVTTAPVSGVLELFEDIEVGTVVPAGRPLFRVYNPDSITIHVRLPESGYKAFAPGAPVEAQDVFDRVYPGRVLFRGSVVSRSDTMFIPCVAVFDRTPPLPIGSELIVDAVHYKGPLIGLVRTAKPREAAIRFGW